MISPFRSMALLTRYQARRVLGDSLVMRIDPRTVFRHAGSNQPRTVRIRLGIVHLEEIFPPGKPVYEFARKCFYSVEPFQLRDYDFSGGIDIMTEARYRLLQDFIENRHNVVKTIWHKKLSDMLKDRGFVFHKEIRLNSLEEIERFLNSYAKGLVDSLERTGYDESKASDIGTAFIDAKGVIQKCDGGNHRFSACRILGVPNVPLEILGVHRDWFRSQVGRGGLDVLRKALAGVEARHREPPR